MRRGRGAYVEDLDGNRYIDYHAACGAILLGHSHPAVNGRVRATMDDQVLFGIGTSELEVAVAEKIVTHVPSAEQVVMCGSGSEATFHAIRLARAATGRDSLLHDGGAVRGACLADMYTGGTREVRAAVAVVCADTMGTPQLLFASGIRPRRWGAT